MRNVVRCSSVDVGHRKRTLRLHRMEARDPLFQRIVHLVDTGALMRLLDKLLAPRRVFGPFVVASGATKARKQDADRKSVV